MLVNVFGESPYLVIDVMLGFCKSFTKGSLFSLQTVLAVSAYDTLAKGHALHESKNGHHY